MLNDALDLNQNFFIKDVEKKSTRDGLGKGLVEAGKRNPDVVVLCGDLTESTRTNSFLKEFPERFIECGISEQNMAGIAAGLALSDKVPFIASFATFSPGRNWEQIRVSICYSNTNVKIIGSHAGLSASQDGPTAQALEDIAITRVLPNMVVIDPIDYDQAYNAVLESAKYKGPVYIRTYRDPSPAITTKFTHFDIGKACVLKEGTDVSVFVTGIITAEVLTAAKNLLEKNKIDVEVVAFPTIKPLDEGAIIKSVRKTKRAVTVEEHQIHGGFGSAVCEVISQFHPVKTKIIGIEDTFCESGSYNELREKYGISAEKIEDKIFNFVRIQK